MPDEYLKKQQSVVEEELEASVREANESIRKLNGHLIIFATAIISFSLLTFQNVNIFLNFTICDKYILSIIWGLLGLSVFFGIIQFIVDYNFFLEWKKYYLTLWEKVIIEKVSENIKEKLGNNIDANALGELTMREIIKQSISKDNKFESSIVWIYLQIICILISLGLLLYIMIAKLFSFS